MPSRVLQVTEVALVAAVGARLILDYAHHQHPMYDAVWMALATLTVALLAVHYRRRELIPLYSVIAVYVYLHAMEWRSWRALTQPTWSHAPFKLSVVGLLLSALMVWLFPLPAFPKLQGRYQTIGCHTGRYGGVECRVFYPSAMELPRVAPKDRVQYLHHGDHLAKGLSVFSRVPRWIFNNLSNAYLASINEAAIAAPPSEQGWPLVIYSHGLAGSLELYSTINEQMASQGNIVVVVNHCDGSASVARPEDHRIEYYQKVSREVIDNVDGAGFRFRNAQLRHRVHELQRVLNAITKLHQEQPSQGLFQHVNLDNVSVWGHSFGGATALTTAHIDPRFRKAVLLDAWMEPVDDEVKRGIGARIPVLHIISDQFMHWRPNMEGMKQHMRGCSHPLSKFLVLQGSRHNNFSDLPLFAPTLNRILLAAGKINAAYAIEAISLASARFLNDPASDYLQGFPELVTIGLKE